MINIGIYNEHKLALEGITQLVQGIPDFNVVVACEQKSVLIDKLKLFQVNVLLLGLQDVSVKNTNLIVQLSINFPKVKILIVSTFNSEEMILKTVKAGAKGFLGRESDFNDMVEAIYTLRNGHDYYGKSITHLLLNRYINKLNNDDGDQNEAFAALSSRQIEILKMWGESHSNQEIADKLFISVRTVESHKNHIMQKLNLKSTVDLVKFAIKNNIIEI
jgi:DNA-binding NarL/FixJ family response regulator